MRLNSNSHSRHCLPKVTVVIDNKGSRVTEAPLMMDITLAQSYSKPLLQQYAGKGVGGRAGH
jgi:hypothetical protein